MGRHVWSTFLCGVAVALLSLAVVACGAHHATSPLSGPGVGRPLPSIMAEPWLKISDEYNVLLEGPAFDRAGHLYFVDVFAKGTIFRVNLSDKDVTTVYDDGQSSFASVDIHADGRLFACDPFGEKILAMNPDGTGVTEIPSAYEGEATAPDDIVFDGEGNFYFADYQGSAANPTGRVFRVSSDYREIDLVAAGLASPNGISLSPDGRRLWIGESGRNALVELTLAEDGVTLLGARSILSDVLGASWPYEFTYEASPDSNAVDEDGNIYQAVFGRGTFVVFDSSAVPVAQVVMPGTADGLHLLSTNLAFQPGTDRAFATAGGKGGAWIFTFKGLAQGLCPFSHH